MTCICLENEWDYSYVSRLIDGIMNYSAVDVTLYIKCMLWAYAYVGWATRSRATAMTRFTFCKKKKKKKKSSHEGSTWTRPANPSYQAYLKSVPGYHPHKKTWLWLCWSFLVFLYSSRLYTCFSCPWLQTFSTIACEPSFFSCVY